MIKSLLWVLTKHTISSLTDNDYNLACKELIK